MPAKHRTLHRDRRTNGYVTSDGRYEVSPVFGSSIRGGDVTRPTGWCLKDRQGEYEPCYRPRLSDIRDILADRPVGSGGMAAKLTPTMRQVLDRIQAGRSVRQGDGTQYRTVKALADRGLIKLETEHPYWGVDSCRHLWSLRRWHVSKVDD